MTGSNLCVLTSAVLSVTVTTVVKALPSVETWILKARVFQSPVPPETLPLNACAGFSSSLQGVLPVAGRCKARFLPVCARVADAQRTSARRAALLNGIMHCHLSRLPDSHIFVVP